MAQHESFHIHVSKDYLKFSAAHFMAYPGFRERLHGHNYRLSIALHGQLGAQGYVVDFGIVKKIARRLCERLDERVLIPSRSDCLTIVTGPDAVIVRYERDEFRFPLGDVFLIPIVHTSVEEIARYLTGELRRELDAEGIGSLHTLEVAVEESFGQQAVYQCEG